MSDFRSPTPLYHRIYTVLRERIVNGYYGPKDLVPAESELCLMFEASRITVRKAVEMLAQEGLVTRTRGRGTFVKKAAPGSELTPPVVSDVSGLLNYLNAVGEGTKVRVLSLDHGEAPPRIAAMFGLPSTSTFVRAARVRMLSGAPYSLSLSYLLPKVGADMTVADLTDTTMIALLQRGNVCITQVEQTMSATLADEVAAQALEVPVGAPLMRVNRLFLDQDMTPFYGAEILYRAERYQYRVTLHRNEDNDLTLAPTDAPARPHARPRAARK